VYYFVVALRVVKRGWREGCQRRVNNMRERERWRGVQVWRMGLSVYGCAMFGGGFPRFCRIIPYTTTIIINNQVVVRDGEREVDEMR
jgi:hypothetical protein